MLSKFIVQLPKVYAEVLTFLIEKKLFNTVEAVMMRGLDLIIDEDLTAELANAFLKERKGVLEADKASFEEFVAPRSICMYCAHWKRNHAIYDGWCTEDSRNRMFDDTCDSFSSI